MDNKEIFRKVALERLSSPDKLDQMIHVVSGKAWIVMSVIFFLTIGLVIWSIVGRINIKVNAEGVLLRSGGVFNVYSLVSGQVTDIAVGSGKEIERGDIIARIMTPAITSEIYLLNQRLEEQKVNYENEVKHIDLLQSQIKDKIKNLQERLEQRKILFNKGLITKEKVLTTTDELNNQIAEFGNLNIKRKESKDKLAELNDKLESLVDERFRVSRIDSPYSGKVIEVKVDPDQLVTEGTKIISLELSGRGIKNLEGILYVNYNEGTMIEEAMDVLISPNGIHAEEFGSMIGKVVSVSSYPVTIESMMNKLQDEQLVKKILETGPKYSVMVDFKTDPNTVSGYAWTSSKGPPVKINSGTLCNGTIILTKRSPISFVLPFLKETFGAY